MPIDARIPLQVKAPEIGQTILDLQERGQRSRLVDLQTRQAESQLKEHEENAPTRKLTQDNEREAAKLKSLTFGAAKIMPFLESGDMEGARAVLDRRKLSLQEVGYPTDETDKAIELFEKDPQKFIDGTKSTIRAGVQLGFLKAPEKADGFTLGQGQRRFDASGKEIAAVAPDKNAGRGEYYTPVPTAGGVVAFNNRTGQLEQPSLGGRPVVHSNSDPKLQGDIAGSKEAATTRAKAVTEAQLELPKAIAAAEQTLKLIGELKTHPGRKLATGSSSVIPKIPGTDQADFIARTEQLKGKQFLEAFQMLKGGGQITEVEGTKAENAMARMDRSQTEGEYVRALEDFEEAVRMGARKLQEKAGQPQQPLRQPNGPAVGTVVNGYRFKGGNPNDKNAWERQ